MKAQLQVHIIVAARLMKEKGRLPLQYSQLLHSASSMHLVLPNLNEVSFGGKKIVTDNNQK